MQKTPDEIKKGLAYCVEPHCPGEKCPYWNAESCAYDKIYDALAHIQQLEATVSEKEKVVDELSGKVGRLEAERDALMHWAKGRCDTCAHKYDCVKHDPDPEGYVMHWYDDCDIWEWRGVQKEDGDEKT